MIIAHPPCTYLTKAGACNIPRQPWRIEEGFRAAEFFMRFLQADCDRIAVENPIPMKFFGLPPYSMWIEPWQFGEPFTKKTCLWLKGLPPLLPVDLVANPLSTTYASWFQSNRGGQRSKNRSKTFWGIARAMALQWGSLENN